MYCGMPIGSYNGDPRSSQLYLVRDGYSSNRRVLSWTLNNTGAYSLIYFDGVAQPEADTSDTEYSCLADVTIKEWIEVFEAPSGLEKWDYSGFCSSPEDAVELSWDAATDAALYHIYRSTVAGAIANGSKVAERPELGRSSYTYDDTDLDDGTYYYAVAAYDEAGNETDSNEISKTIDAPPAPPTGLALTFTP